MKIFNYLVIGSMIQFATSCQQNTNTKSHLTLEEKTSLNLNEQSISTKNSYSTAPFITKDANNNPVVCWAERIPGEEKKSILMYAVSKDGGQTFGKPIIVTPSTGTKAHHESMNKVAFKKDNTVVAVYSLSPKNSKNRFASDIFYTQSKDDGATWSKPKTVHKDTVGTSHSFFDLAALPNGEVGCCWLNSGKNKGGRPVMFAQTDSQGFVNETVVDEIACQCCRTELFVDPHGNINISYRDIINDSIRDMVVSRSTDLGKTFSEPKRISKDNWVINGCPHTGPTMAFNEGKLQFAWFTQGGGKGLYYTESSDHGETFNPRQLIDESAKHPQMVTLNEGQTILVWDEPYMNNDTTYGHVVYQIRSGNKLEQKQYVTKENVHAQFPVISALDPSHSLVVWVQSDGENSYIYTKIIEIEQKIIG